MDDIYLQWEDCEHVLNRFGENLNDTSSESLNLRIYQTTKKGISLETLIDKILAFLGFKELFLSQETNVIEKSIIGVLLILSISPFKFKVLKGKGIDDLIEFVKIDDSGNHYIKKDDFERICTSALIKDQVIKWFENNDILSVYENKIIFNKKSLKSGKVYQKI